MTDKPRKPKKGLEEPEARYQDAEDDERPLTDTELDTWIERNKDALNVSIERAHQARLRGACRTLDEVMAEIEARAAERDRKRKAQPK